VPPRTRKKKLRGFERRRRQLATEAVRNRLKRAAIKIAEGRPIYDRGGIGPEFDHVVAPDAFTGTKGEQR
jgi:hypothetical protein